MQYWEDGWNIPALNLYYLSKTLKCTVKEFFDLPKTSQSERGRPSKKKTKK